MVLSTDFKDVMDNEEEEDQPGDTRGYEEKPPIDQVNNNPHTEIFFGHLIRNTRYLQTVMV